MGKMGAVCTRQVGMHTTITLVTPVTYTDTSCLTDPIACKVLQ